MNFNVSIARPVFGLLMVASLLVSGVGQAQTLPLKVTAWIAETVNPPGAGPCGLALTGHITGTGISSQGGAVTVASTDCIAPVSVTPTGAEFIASSDTLTITAANGDQIVARYTVSFSVTFTGAPGPEGVPGIGVINGNFQITGGSGRFLGATGGGTLRGAEQITFDPATLAGRGVGRVDLTGTISR